MERHPVSVIYRASITPEGNQVVCSSRRSKRSIVLHLLGWWLISLLGWQTIAPTQAEGLADNVPGTSLYDSQDIYAYVVTGNILQWSVTKVNAQGDNHFQVRIYSPTGLNTTYNCTVGAGGGINTQCTNSFAATETGIYTIRIIRLPATTNTTNTTNAKVNWQVNVRQANNTNIPGRVYVKTLVMYDAGTAHDFNLRYVTEYGYQYLAAYRGFRGHYSRVSADGYGVRFANSCLSAHQSMDIGNTNFGPPSVNCGGLYNIFFNAPSGVPASSNRWDYNTGQQVVEWINPTIQTPAISSLTFSSTSLTNRAGSFSFNVANFSGNAKLQIDVNHNGSYTDAVDRTIDFNALAGSNTIAWDGRDGTGALVSCSQNVQARVLIDREAEIHFTMVDVEGLGSLAVTRQNGAGAPNSTLYWDDSKLATTGRCAAATPTNPLSATAGVNSAGGVHGWNYPASCPATGTWGGERYIDNWAFVASAAQALMEVPSKQPGSLTASVSSLSICSGGEVAINYTTTPAGETVRWSRMPENSGGIGNVQDFPINTGTAPVSYTYTAYIPSVSGCESNTVTTVVTVNPVPIVTPSQCSQTICSGQAGNITFLSSVPGSTINWLRVEDNLAGTGDISEVMNNAGNFTYKIWATSPAPASCPSSTTITCAVVVNDCCDLVASTDVKSLTSCSGVNDGAITINYTGSQTYEYSLDGGSFVALGTSPHVITGLAAGTYAILIQAVGDTSCKSELMATVFGVTPFQVNASSNSPVCSGTPLELYSTATDLTYAPFTYLWTGPNGFSSNQPNPVLANPTASASGDYTVLITGANGCSSSSTISILVTDIPDLSLGLPAGNSMTVCSGTPVQLAVSGANGANVSWQASTGQTGTGTTIDLGTLTNNSSEVGVIKVVVLAQSSGCQDSEVIYVTVKPIPILQLTPKTAIVCNLENVTIQANSLIPGATIDWTRTPNTPNPPPASGTGTGSVLITQALPPDTYTYSFITTYEGCSSSPQTVTVTVQQ